MDDRFDVVLFGPTGVTGREVARHLARRAPELGMRWAVAGRDPERIRTGMADLASQPDAVLHADAGDPASIDAMVAAARVVANLVGPYARYGEVVYEACARRGADQLDLTGELDWVARMIRTHGAAASASGARIVPTAGFEALPFDLGMLVAARAAHARSGQPVVDVDIAASTTSTATMSGLTAAVSGGTFISGVEALRRGPEGFRDPHLLDPPGAGGQGRFDLRPRRHPGTGAWLAPLVPLPFLNPTVAHRSAALLRLGGDPTFSPRFRYREGMVVPAPVPGSAPVVAASLASVGALVGLVARAPGVVRRSLADGLLRIGPSAGDGPRPEDLDKWSYRLEIRATAADGTTADVTVDAQGHPGYKSTATMVGEAALILADAEAPVPATSGFATPATALGADVVDRFEHAGLTFRTHE